MENTDANATYHLFKLLMALGIIDNFMLYNNRFLPLKATWRSR